jgi:prophage regulatory protein
VTESLLRIWQIVGDRKRGIDPLIGISKSAFWAGVADGRYPKGILLSKRTRVWTASSIQKVIADLTAASEGGAQ